MPISYTCDDTDRILTWTVSDPIAPADWHEAFDRVEQDTAVRRVRPIGIIMDIRGRLQFQQHAGIRSFALDARERLTRLGRAGMPAAVVVSHPVAHGMTRMTEGYMGDAVQMRIFNDMDAARGWIVGVEEARPS